MILEFIFKYDIKKRDPDSMFEDMQKVRSVNESFVNRVNKAFPTVSVKVIENE